MSRRVVVLAAAAATLLVPAVMPSLATAGAPIVNAPTAPATTAAAGYSDWPTYHGDNLRSGNNITAKHPVGKPIPLWSIPLDGAVYGQPIVVDHGHTVVATEHNSVYGLNYNKVLWKVNFGPPVPTSMLPCGDIDPLGITGTMAYDAVTNTVIGVVERSNPFRHVAFGVNPVNGAIRWVRTVDVPSSVAGISPQAMQQRGALLVGGRTVFIAYGGLAGDCSSYRGSVVGLNLDTPTKAPLWHFTVPTSREGGIWAPPGPVEDTGKGIFVAVGNGATASTGNYDYSDSVLLLAYQQIQSSFSPSSWRTDNANDLDLGSQGPTVVGNYVYAAGKSGTAYVLNKAALGGIGGEVSQLSLCRSFGGTAVVGNVVYVPCTDGVRAVRINSDGTMTVLWHAAANINGTPTAGGGYLFVLDIAAGVLNMLNPATGASVWTLPVGAVNRFAAPAVYANLVLVGTMAGVKAFSW
ncbi:MAG TPA: PQQ-binding-like beta-propeller repeat protein [Jatrophihabitans sp.]|nr:PQQ-binding-like beta-propeller repeat protein [Jatrophihabitans sp.]